MARVLIALLLALILPPGAAADDYEAVDPAKVGYVYIGDGETPDGPSGSGVYRVEVVGPTKREHSWGGGRHIRVPLTGLDAGNYVIRAYDGLGNVTEKKLRIVRRVAGPTEPAQIVRSTAPREALPQLQKPEKILSGPPECRVLTFGPAGAGKIFSANDNNACLWDTAEGVAVSLAISGGTMGAMPGARAGQFIVHGEGDRGLSVLDLDTRRSVALPSGGRDFMPSSVVLSPDKRTVVACGQEFLSKEDWNKRAYLALSWDLSKPAAPRDVLTDFHEASGLPSCLCYSPDARTFVARQSEMLFVDAFTWKVAQRFYGGYDLGAMSCAFSPDGRRLYLGMNDGLQTMRKSADGRWSQDETWIRAAPGLTEMVALSPDGTRLASVSKSRLLTMWDAGTGKLLWKATAVESWMRDMRFSEDGKTFSASSYVDGSLRTWDVATGRLLLLMRPEPRRDVEY
ncbi:MAG: WD40 repeat domain-containing protein [Elusimicrobiota bacterium]|nr:MAG: WD40 repeat domain-containing protein [Elusimicrobiota bacterium]